MPAPTASAVHLPPVLPITDMALMARSPLRGLTILAVEDSRFACDALRLLCQRSGARLRRAETLQAARAHLRLYRPDVVLVDMGLPDGRGEDLIRDLAALARPRPVILGISGAPERCATAMAAGADGFLGKPFPRPAAFQASLLALLPGRNGGACIDDGDAPAADPLALRDDLAHAAALLAAHPTGSVADYVSCFVLGVARTAGDVPLATAIGKAELAELLAARLATPPAQLIAPRPAD
ncbi:response regulator [Gemmobacter fulvus]|uniref:response regulator n=1 Tax=Gemmobacter fulvus TaxID=2840474 RepID=UPI002796689D|nr:response regulator [Gemmobacter fulvus]MDQ1849534.1 response regulator [Gemmobacter fulvus]